LTKEGNMTISQTKEKTEVSASDRFEIQEVLSSYGVHHDARDFDALAECFTEDAIYTMKILNGDTIGPRMGRNEIVGQIQRFKESQHDQRRHLISNFLMRPDTAHRVRVTSYVVVTAADVNQFGVVTAGLYRDVVVRTPLGWRIQEKILELDSAF
jgi:3-phenylpropionate/cinnamic acid dioxygenase small subunit